MDLCSRRLLAAPTCDHPNAELAMDAIKMAVAVRGGAEAIRDVVFHSDYAEVLVKSRDRVLACAGGVR